GEHRAIRLTALQPVYVALHGRRPAVEVAVVDAVILRFVRDGHELVRQQKLANLRVQRKAVHAGAGRVDHHGARAIENIAGSHEFAPRLQDIFQPAALLPVETAEDGKDRADAYVDVDIGGAVERIVDENVTT